MAKYSKAEVRELVSLVGGSDNVVAIVAGMFGVMSNGIGVGGLPGILSIKPQFWAVYAICILIAIVVPVVITMAIFKRKEGKVKAELSSAKA